MKYAFFSVIALFYSDISLQNSWSVIFGQYWSLLYLQAESLVNAQQEIGETMGQLGLAFVKLTKFETEEATYDYQRTRAADMKNVATAAVKASRLYRELNSQTVKHLVNQLVSPLLLNFESQ